MRLTNLMRDVFSVRTIKMKRQPLPLDGHFLWLR
jgi:hypothetical protein